MYLPKMLNIVQKLAKMPKSAEKKGKTFKNTRGKKIAQL